jgi:hypothetical protein
MKRNEACITEMREHATPRAWQAFRAARLWPILRARAGVAAMLWRFFIWVGEVVGGFCAALLASVVLFGAVGFAIALPFTAAESCWPQHSLFFVFVRSCESNLAGAAWFGTVELARLAVALPALSIHYIQDVIRDWPEYRYVMGSITWMVTVLTLLAVWAGFRNLRKRVPALAWGLLTMYVAQAAVLATPADMSAPVQSACGQDRHYHAFYITAFREPLLSCGASPDDESYRLLWLPSFEDPIAVRIYRRGTQYGLVAVVLEDRGPGGDFSKRAIKKRLDKTLSPAEWRRAVAMLEELGFWRLKTNPDDTFGIDGTLYVMEGSRGGRYHVADRLGGLELEALGKQFLRLAGLDVRPAF